MKEINLILDKYDIGAIVILHEPGSGEFNFKLNPSYSYLDLKAGGIGFKTIKEEEKELKLTKIESSINMLNIFNEILAMHVPSMLDLEEELTKKYNPDHSGLGASSTQQQDN